MVKIDGGIEVFASLDIPERPLEPPIGSFVEVNGVVYETVPFGQGLHHCYECAFHGKSLQFCQTFQCSSDLRKDKTIVYFKDVGI